MAYQQGPLLLQAAANVGVVTTDYKFAADVEDKLGDLETTPAGWDSFLTDAGVLLTESSDPFPDVDLDAAMQTVHAYSDPESLLGVSAMVRAVGFADIALGSVISYAPAEAWIDSGSPFVAPAPVDPLSVPAINPADLVFSVTGTVPTTPTTTTTTTPGVFPPRLGPSPDTGTVPTVTPQINTTTVSLLNTSQYGAPNFRVGDHFEISVLGSPGATISVDSTLNGNSLGSADKGTIALNGNKLFGGTMDENSVGIWNQQWYVGGVLIQSFDFTVVDA